MRTRYVKTLKGKDSEVPDDLISVLPQLRQIRDAELKIKRLEKEIGGPLGKILKKYESQRQQHKLANIADFIDNMGGWKLARFFWEACYRIDRKLANGK